ncbi:MAG: phosphomannomutase/phosphoglucomutase [Xanthomonadaceae bacterium]|nr:phosphomannomutase/phosphoglucomutase [Xanthomonadaceae bacterium]
MTNTNRNRQATNHLKWLAPLLSAALAVLAALFIWSGINQWRAAATETIVVHTRDELDATVTKTLENLARKMTQKLALPSVKKALEASDAAAAAAAISNDWTDVEQTGVWPETLDAAYSDPVAFGYSRLALLEEVLKDQEIRVAAVRMGETVHLAIAAPVSYGTQERGVAYVQLPLQQLTEALEGAAESADIRAVLRKDGVEIAAAGLRPVSGSASSVRAIGKTGFEMVIYSSETPYRPFDLGSLGCIIAAIVLLLLAVAAFRLPKLLGNVNQRRREYAVYEDANLTLNQTAQRDVPPKASIPRIAVKEKEAGNETAPKDEPDMKTLDVTKIDMDPSIFRAYDVRGIAKQNLTPEVSMLIGRAIGSMMQEQGLSDIVVGRDGRLSSMELADALIEGLQSSGRNVIDLGLVPTPVVYFAAYFLRTGSGVMVTGSHNPPEYNGFKIVIGGEALYGDTIQALYKRIQDNQLHQAGEPGTLRQAAVTEDYIQRIADDVQLQRPLKVVIDAGNGAAGEIAPQLLEAIGAEVVPLHCDIDGTFPNHRPDPSEPENLMDLIKSVEQFDADLGLALDGDGDRLGVVDKKGNIIFADRLLMLFAEDILLRNPGATIIYDVKSTGKLSGHILRHGGSPMMWKTGHSLIRAKIRETGAELAGEMSGHFFFGERWYGFDDGLYSAARLLEILSSRDESPAEVLDALPTGIMTPEIKVPVNGENPHTIAARLVENVQNDGSLFAGANITTIDGLRADWPDGWGLLRASNTTPVLTLRFEADTAETLNQIKQIFHRALQQTAPDMPLDF